MSRRPIKAHVGPSKITTMARAICSDDPGDYDRLPASMREYWERIAGRVYVHLDRLKKAECEMAEFMGEAA